ncbi:hypothetical protein FFLO_06029 [Filobasidium floriforme]|uniref:NADP-dependent oxidoreductase domain-containing protein n=1 Tax=Filobasidium floriforme TaxID=5210 RepID=A0A8K0JFP2_9TREE|nr:aldo/keto reductase [Filobasidium floriforme]KAG7528636.1 hypothetical protein FFLO_06029 [Filobasidium floriforme]KAH8087086.1 aldo/keto reductase [Filobasidium floriforme]
MTSPIAQRQLGSSGLQVGAIGFGAMMMTWCDPKEVKSDEDAFASIKSAVDAGATFINSGAFYGNPGSETANLELLRRFFDKYPDYVDRVVLSVKGGAKGGKIFSGIDASMENLRADLDRIHTALGPKKKVDIYEVARVDPTMTIEEIMKNLVELKEEGHFKHIGVSEIHPTALRKAHAVHPIAAAEIEISVFNLQPEALEVVKVAEELGIAVVAYSPLGRGMLTGRYRSPEDIPADDVRKKNPQFQGDNFKINLEIVDKLTAIAEKKGVSSGQLALAWLLQKSDKIIPIPGSGSAKRTVENIQSVNVHLSSEELGEIEGILSKFKPAGDRYANNGHGLLWGKGRED